VSNSVNVKDLKAAEDLDDCPPPPVHVGLDGTLWAVDSTNGGKERRERERETRTPPFPCVSAVIAVASP
jgi:hypothetical protein